MDMTSSTMFHTTENNTGLCVARMGVTRSVLGSQFFELLRVGQRGDGGESRSVSSRTNHQCLSLVGFPTNSTWQKKKR